MQEKIEALAKFLGCEEAEVTQTAYDTYEAREGEFVVMTSEEAEMQFHLVDGFHILRIK